MEDYQLRTSTLLKQCGTKYNERQPWNVLQEAVTTIAEDYFNYKKARSEVQAKLFIQNTDC